MAGFGATSCQETIATQRKLQQGEETPREWAKLFQSWFDKNPLPKMAFDRENLTILAVNEAAIRDYGYCREEFLAMTIKDIRPPEEASRLSDALRVGDGGFTGPFIGRHRKKDGSVFDVEVYAQRETWGSRTIVLAQIHHVTAHKRADSKFQPLLEAAADPMVVVNPEGKIVLVDARFEQVFGYRREELLGQEIELLVPERFRPPHVGHRKSFFGEPHARPMAAGLDSVTTAASSGPAPTILFIWPCINRSSIRLPNTVARFRRVAGHCSFSI